jgi:hypothetical protein
MARDLEGSSRSVWVAAGVAGLVLAWGLVTSAVNFFSPESSGDSFLGVGAVFWFAVGILVVGALLAVVVRFTAPDYVSGRTMEPGFADTVAASSVELGTRADAEPENAGATRDPR